MAIMPLYPGYRRPKEAATASRAAPAVEARETAADRHATRQGDIARNALAARLESLTRELRGWQGVLLSRGAEALRLLEREGEVPDWLRQSQESARAEMEALSTMLRRLRADAWDRYTDAFIDERGAMSC